MMKATIRWVLPLVSLFVLGPIAGWMVGTLRPVSGASGATLLVGADPVKGMLVLVGVLALAGAVAVAGSRLFAPRPGLAAAGWVIGWAAWANASADMMFRTTEGNGVLMTLALEGLLVAGAGAALISVCFFLGSRGGDAYGGPIGRQIKDSVGTGGGLVSVLAAAVAAAAVVWLTARTGLRGQAVFAAMLGGIAAGVAAKLAGDSAGEDGSPPVAAFIGVLVLAVLAPLSGLIKPGGDLATAAVSGELTGLVRLMPMDWLFAALFGVPIGLGWAGLALEPMHGQQESAGSAATA